MDILFEIYKINNMHIYYFIFPDLIGLSNIKSKIVSEVEKVILIKNYLE